MEGSNQLKAKVRMERIQNILKTV